MDQTFRDKFTNLWRRYFNNAELPITFEYADTPRDATPEPPFAGHRCMIAQFTAARQGRTLCLRPESVACRGGNRYLNFTAELFPGFHEYISHNAEGHGERYQRTPEQVAEYIDALIPQPIRGTNLIFKRWDRLTPDDTPDGLIFFATPDVLSGLFTLIQYDAKSPDAVIAPFGSGCCTTIYMTYREQIQGSGRAVLGMFDPSARKCVKPDLLTLSIPYMRFEPMVDQMEESFLATHSWELIQRRIK